MLPDIPKSLAELAKAVTPKAATDFSELISLKLFGKPLARLRAEAENAGEAVRQEGQIQREIQKPFIVEIETAKAYRQYSNLGTTLQKAIPHIVAPANTMNEDNDVFWGLLEHAKEISNEEMQELISKIIAGEYNNPETYSISTLQVLKSLGKKEIELFEKICSLLVSSNMLPSALFSNDEVNKDFMKETSLHFGSLQTLQNLGLFLPNSMTNTIPNPEKKKYQITYMGERISFECENENTNIVLPSYYAPSEAGMQILQHLNPQENNNYIDWLKEKYTIPNYKIVD